MSSRGAMTGGPRGLLGMFGDLKITNKIQACERYCLGPIRRKDEDITYIVNHRGDPQEISEKTGKGYAPGIVGLAQAHYRRHFKGAVGQLPYHFAILPNGTIEQGRPVSDLAPHAVGKYGRKGVGIVWVGNFNVHLPTQEQWNNGLMLNHALQRLYSVYIGDIGGHSSWPGASGRKNNDCPGAKFDLLQFKDELKELERRYAWDLVRGSGMVL